MVGQKRARPVSELIMPSPVGNIRIVGEDIWTLGWAELAARYPHAINLGSERYRPSSAYGIYVSDCAVVLVGAGGGGTAPHDHSALVLDGKLYLAIGDQISRFALRPFAPERAIEADSATCFGLYHVPKYDALICHGELEITRLDLSLDICWQAGGRDIFTGDFVLRDDFIEVSDFQERRYQFDYETGRFLERP
jgi:hypothetical protein